MQQSQGRVGKREIPWVLAYWAPSALSFLFSKFHVMGNKLILQVVICHVFGYLKSNVLGIIKLLWNFKIIYTNLNIIKMYTFSQICHCHKLRSEWLNNLPKFIWPEKWQTGFLPIIMISPYSFHDIVTSLTLVNSEQV